MSTEQPNITADEAEVLRLFRNLNCAGMSRALEALEEFNMITRYTDKSENVAYFRNEIKKRGTA